MQRWRGLHAALDGVRHGRGEVVAVVGEPGVGKSRLFHELTHSHRVAGCRILQASSMAYGRATSCLPVIDLLKVYLRIDERDDIRSIRAKVTGHLLTLDEALKDVVPPVLWLLDVMPEEDSLWDLEPPRRRQLTLDAVKRLLLRESWVQPLILVLEDLHWIDAETRDLLDSLVEGLPAAPVCCFSSTIARSTATAGAARATTASSGSIPCARRARTNCSGPWWATAPRDRTSTRLNSSHGSIAYAVF